MEIDSSSTSVVSTFPLKTTLLESLMIACDVGDSIVTDGGVPESAPTNPNKPSGTSSCSSASTPESATT